METLVKIIEEKMLLIEQLESQLTEKTNELDKAEKGSTFWYQKYKSLEVNPQTSNTGTNE